MLKRRRLATAARKTRNRVIAGTGAVGAGLYTAHELAKSAGQSDAVKKRLGLPVNKANGGMLDSPAAVKRDLALQSKGFKKGGMATKWESKWGRRLTRRYLCRKACRIKAMADIEFDNEIQTRPA